MSVRSAQSAAPAGGPSLRMRHKARVQRLLAETARRLFRARGFDGVTVDAIAAGAGVSRRSFFRYFPSKEAVLFARRKEHHARFREILRAAPRTRNVIDILHDALFALAAEYTSLRAQILEERAIVRSHPQLVAFDLEMDRADEELIAVWCAARAGHGQKVEHRARLFAAALMAVLRVTIDAWAEGGGRADLRKLGTEALGLVAPLAPSRIAATRR